MCERISPGFFFFFWRSGGPFLSGHTGGIPAAVQEFEHLRPIHHVVFISLSRILLLPALDRNAKNKDVAK
jgi:hypothetical protein